MVSIRSHITTLLLFVSLIPFPAGACLQTTGTSIHGGRVSTGHDRHFWELMISLRHSPGEHLEHLLTTRQLEPDDDFPEQEAAGVREVLMGNYDAAIALFKEVEAGNPGRYTTAANLGTAYELKGELELALEWISEGMRRNPDSHGGTEWLHVEIIKTRMKLRDDPEYLRSHHIIGLPDSFPEGTNLRIAGKDYTRDDLRDALFHQLKERMIFVKPQDPVVADLLYTFGDLVGRSKVVESGLKLLELSGRYGIQDNAALDAKISHFKWLIRWRMTWQTMLFGGLPVLFLSFAYRRKWFFLSRRAEQEHRLGKLHRRTSL